MPGYELIGSEEQAEVADVFERGGVLFRHGFEDSRNGCYKVAEFERNFINTVNASYGLAVSSGTAALRIALAALGIGYGDEVITQCFTFVATVEAIIESGATPVCADIDLTLNLDPYDLERRITSRTKAVIAVHMLGVPARLKEIQSICERHGLKLIEDAAWGCGGKLMGKNLGTWGDIGTFSFDYAKTMTTGEGGMLTFRDESTYLRAAAWHDHGHENNPNVPRWEDTRTSSGFNFRMMELQGALGLAQLRKLDRVINAQKGNYTAIWNSIKHIAGIEAREIPGGSDITADAFVFLVPNKDKAISCRQELLNTGIKTKILPEAIGWHFAGEWSHMRQLVHSHGGNLKEEFNKSKTILDRAVSVPVGVHQLADIPYVIHQALEKALS